MRHVPPVEVLVRRLEMLKVAVEVVTESTRGVAENGEVERHLSSAARWFEHLESTLRHRHADRNAHGAQGDRAVRSVDQAIAALRGVDRVAFRKRSPFHLFERSRVEAVVASVAAAECHLDAATEAAARFVEDIHWRVASRRDPVVIIPDRVVMPQPA